MAMKTVEVRGDRVVITTTGRQYLPDSAVALSFDEVCSAAQALRAHLAENTPVDPEAPTEPAIDARRYPHTVAALAAIRDEHARERILGPDTPVTSSDLGRVLEKHTELLAAALGYILPPFEADR